MIKKDQDESTLSFKAYFLLSTENVYRTGGVFDLLNERNSDFLLLY